ncbi:ORF6N domain-containing protein [Paenibacillus alvei]|uniref:ORF6N domain-containing protein n=1 Tax=Paenibacillus alvei TaxID=44250 RepID=UPI000289A2E8|nr:ORF6N domain-containing protein [Paenibacillus alvei]EJW20048.1 hypothetical protein PAV_1c10440 [Paenibacillus alvei DSM 29]MCY9539428.1 ORF6N domain-containing protein [Paenibacillus alvei]MCY9703874.1 ORF6N domain-containing protein [Paenibacillus alvei]MCY9733873.1 ORF6N domain-containing protein [Paenibacillus alvei]MCY9755157.1 ORF6N domain-containing protein [Paenibacillus alvei]
MNKDKFNSSMNDWMKAQQNKPVINGTTNIGGIEVPNISGGFGDDKKSMLVKDIAAIHGRQLFKVNEAINNNEKRFVYRVDIIDVKRPEYKEFAILLVDSGIMTQNAVNAANNIFILSERGYAKLLKIFDDDLAWDKYEEIIDGYFRKRGTTPNVDELSPILQLMIKNELEQKALKRDVATLQNGLDTLTENLTAVPDPAKVKDLINEYQRWTRLEYDQIYCSIYEIMLDQHGLDIPRRLNNERERIDVDYFERTGRHYAEKTLKQKVSGIDVMVRMGVLDKFHSILVGMLAKAKSANTSIRQHY